MAVQKYSLAFTFVVILVISVAVSFVPLSAYPSKLAANGSHHLTIGYRQPNDRLVLLQNVSVPSKWLAVNAITKFYNIPRPYNITQIRALDMTPYGKGAYPSLMRGGPGSQNVTLKFTSQRGEPINFSVELYAKAR